MDQSVNDEFLRMINENLGIAYKVSRSYFHDSETRADVHQEMMYQLWKSFKNFDGRSKFSTWMYSVCLNTALTYRRKEKNTAEPLVTGHENIADQHPQHEDENIRLLFEAIGTLTPINKAIVLLYLEDLSYEEIADVTGITKSNVSVRLVRIKKELEHYMKNKSNS